MKVSTKDLVALYRATPWLGKLPATEPTEWLSLAAKKKLVVDRYTDRAVGHLEKNAEGRLAVTRVVLSPVIEFAGSKPTAAQLTELHDSAHHHCFIANSVTTEVSVADPASQPIEGSV